MVCFDTLKHRYRRNDHISSASCAQAGSGNARMVRIKHDLDRQRCVAHLASDEAAPRQDVAADHVFGSVLVLDGANRARFWRSEARRSESRAAAHGQEVSAILSLALRAHQSSFILCRSMHHIADMVGRKLQTISTAVAISYWR